MSKSMEHALNVKAMSFWPPYYKDAGKYLNYLFTNPAYLDEVVENLIEIFCTYANDTAMMDNMVLCLANQLIETDNVQYIGSLCCVHLCDAVIAEDNSSTFRSSFLTRLTKMRRQFEASGHKDHEAFNFLYLITEFALQLSGPISMDFIFRAIISSITSILDHQPSIESLKCIHRVIKMSRLQLCKQCPGEFEQLAFKLREIIINDTTSQEHRRHLLDTIILMVVCKATPTACQSSSLQGAGEVILNEFDGLKLSNGTGSSSGQGVQSEVVSYGVTIFNDQDETYIMPNEEVEPEMYEDFEHFLEGLDGMDEHAEEAFDGFLADAQRKQGSGGGGT